MATDDDVDRLYELDLDAFVPERDALAKRLRADKDREGADAVKARAKPSRAAWAVNRVVRTQPKAVDALTAAADGLAEAQEAALSGGDAKAMRGAMHDVRAAIGALVEHVPEGESEATREAVASTLQAAVMDPEAREAVLAARLERELEPAGFGGLGSSAPRRPAGKRTAPKPKPEAEPEPKAKAKPKPKTKAKAKARAARKRAEAAIADTRKALTAARKAVTAADKERDAAAKAHERAAENAERARTALEAAEAELADTDARRDAARTTYDDRAREAGDLEAALDRAEAELTATD